MRGGSYEDAVKEFARAVLANPDDPKAHRMLGVAYYWTGQIEQAELEIRESLRLKPDSAHSHLLMGIIQAFKGNMEGSYNAFKRAARYDPKRADIQMNLGSMEETLGMYPEALAHFRKAVELDKRHPLYHFQLGLLYRRLGRDEEAIASLKKATRLYSGFEDAWLELGAILERQGRLRKATNMFEKSVRLKNRDSVARFRLARLYLKDGKAKKAREVLREVFHLTPSDETGGLALSLSFGGTPEAGGPGGKGRPGERNQPSGQGGETKPSDPKGPLDVLKRNLNRLPLDQEAQLNIDIAFIPKPKVMEKKKTEGPTSLKAALARAGKMPTGTTLGARREFLLNATSPQARARQIAAVVEDLKNVLDSAPKDAETRMGMNLSFTEPSGLGGAPDGKKKGKVAYQPRDVGNDMGLWVKGTGWMTLIEEVLAERGRDIAYPDSADWWSVEGVGHAVLGRSRMAAQAFAKALEIDPDNELAHLGVGVARVIAGDEKGAAESYKRALKINPSNKTAAEGLKWLEREPTSESTP
jgi:tetratricopeptide (TPR) repeat protein